MSTWHACRDSLGFHRREPKPWKDLQAAEQPEAQLGVVAPQLGGVAQACTRAVVAGRSSTLVAPTRSSRNQLQSSILPKPKRRCGEAWESLSYCSLQSSVGPKSGLETKYRGALVP